MRGSYQDRLALFGKTLFAFAALYLGLGIFLHFRSAVPFFTPGREYHLIATAIAFAIWQIARRPQLLDPFALKSLDVTGTLGLGVCLVVMGHHYSQLFPLSPSGNFAGILSVFHVVLTRAIVVPSTPRRTLLVTALCFASLVVSQQLLFRSLATVPPYGSSPWSILIGSLTWSATGTALATVASKVIYGLHKEVREARQLGQYTLEEKIGARRDGRGLPGATRHAAPADGDQAAWPATSASASFAASSGRCSSPPSSPTRTPSPSTTTAARPTARSTTRWSTSTA